MRVIGGSARGRTIRAPRNSAVRPTSDRVREAIFDVLTHLEGSDEVVEAAVVDLFAGSGALGLEALSRGAASVTFVEQDRSLTTTIEENLRATGLAAAGRTQVVRGEVLAYLASTTRGFDLALADPPYAFADWSRLLARLEAALVVLESRHPVELGERFRLHRVYRYGTTLVTVARRREGLARS